MSAAIALTLAKMPAQISTGESQPTTDIPADGIAGVDFASLLLGQLAASAALPLDLPPSADSFNPDSSAPIAGNLQDPALLLAAIGMSQAPGAFPVDSDLTLPSEIGASIRPTGWDGLPLGNSPNNAGETLFAASAAPTGGWDELTMGREPDQAAPTGLPATTSSIGKPAIIAGADLAAPDSMDSTPPSFATGKGDSGPITTAVSAVPAKVSESPDVLPDMASRNAPVSTHNLPEHRPGPESIPMQYTATHKSVATDSATLPTAIAVSPAPPPSGNAVTPAPAPLRIDTPFLNPAWAGDFSQKIVWMASNNKQMAHLTLNPPEMGPIEISLNLNKDGASAFFVSPSAEVRQSIENALPRLKEMLAGVGIELGQSNVGSQSFQQQTGNNEARQSAPRWITNNAILERLPGDATTRPMMPMQQGNGLVDTFA